MRPRLLLATLSLTAFGNTLRGSFHFDDYSLFAAPMHWTSLFRLETTRPLTWLTFYFNRMAGPDPILWHAVDLLLHLVCVLLLFDCLRRIVPEECALVGAAIFAIHPLQTEAVAYVFARSTLFMTLFCLWSWSEWLQGKVWLAVAIFALALLSKEECVFFPLFLALVFWRRQWQPLAAMLALSALAGARVVAATKVVAGSGAGFSASVTPFDYALAQGAVIWRYLLELVWPAGLSVDPDLHPTAVMGIAGWGLIVLLVVMFRKRVEWRWFTGALVLILASSSVFPASDLAAERRIYLPMISLACGLALLINKLPRWVPVCFALVWLPVSIARTETWRTEEALWRDAAAKSPGKLRPVLQLSRAVPAEEGLRLLDQAAALHPESPEIPAEKGRILIQSGHPDLALTAFGRVVALRPGDAQAISNLGVALAMLGQKSAADLQFRRALGFDPCLPDARKNLGMAPCRGLSPAPNSP